MEQPKSKHGAPKVTVEPNFFLCANIRATGTTEENQHCNVQKYNQLILTTNDQVLQSYSQLAMKKETATKQDFQMWEQATGRTFSRKAMMLDPDLLAKHILQPCQQFCHDYMHGILQGTGPVAPFHFLLALEECMPAWATLEQYFQFLHFPNAWKCQHVHSYPQEQPENQLSGK